MDIVILNNNNKYLLEKFISENNSNQFTYYNSRDINIIKNHKITIIGTVNNAPIAYGHIDFNANINWLGLCILKNFQRKGYGKQIMKYLLDYINSNEINNVKLTVNIDNYSALNLYLKNNFCISTITNNYYVLEYNNTIKLPVSLGEALDKLTILDIKLDKIKDNRLEDVKKEYFLLFETLKMYIENSKFYYDMLKQVNLDIWEMQDDFRSNKGDNVSLCLKIIEYNDSRFRIKKKINDIVNSSLKEQKGYNLKKAFVLTHLGLGDNITSIGMIRYLSTLYDEVLVVCKNNNKENVELLYSDDLSIKILGIDNDTNISPKFGYPMNKFKNLTYNYDLYMCGFHNLENKNCNYKTIPYSFYKQINIPFNTFWNYFYIPNTIKSLELFNIVKNQKYIFIHNSSSSGIVFPIDMIEKKFNINKYDILFINPNINCYNKDDKMYSLANKFIGHKLPFYIEIIKNSEYNILSDSSFFCIAINLEIKNDNNYYISKDNNSYDILYNLENKFKNKFKKIFKKLTIN